MVQLILEGGERLPPSVPLKGYTMLYGYGLYGYCVSCVSCAAIVVCLHEQKATVFGEEMSLQKKLSRLWRAKKSPKHEFRWPSASTTQTPILQHHDCAAGTSRRRPGLKFLPTYAPVFGARLRLGSWALSDCVN